MASPLATFKQGPRPNPTTDEMLISQSTSDPTAVYIQLKKRVDRAQTKMMHFKINPDDIDDIITVLRYAKKVIIDE